MPANTSQPAHFYLHVAHKIGEASTEFAGIIHQARRKRELSRTVHALNALLRCSDHYKTALTALRRLGLEHAG